MPIVPPKAISPWLEMGAYEALWSSSKASFKKIADRFKAHPGATPSEFVRPAVAEIAARQVLETFKVAGVGRFGVRINGTGEYPEALRRAENPIELLYYQGNWDLIHTRCISVVGTRNPSPEGVTRARKLVRSLVEDHFTIVSGLAVGVDTIAHRTAIESGGLTVGVIGTPLSEVYPRENIELQRQIAREFLLISQVPVLRYRMQTPYHNKLFFPARNVTMAALSEATVIIEAGETSGTLTQARAALQQGKQLFILDNCFENKNLTWPERFQEQGAIRVKTYADIQQRLGVSQDRSAELSGSSQSH